MVGVLQDILIDPDFVTLQSDFCLRHCGTFLRDHFFSFDRRGKIDFVFFLLTFLVVTEVFENMSENKLIYTDLFKQYTNLIGTELNGSLQ
jgi:hypothetical protein